MTLIVGYAPDERGAGALHLGALLARSGGDDLLVCSVSSFSMLAAFVSDRPYLWFAPQLTEVDDRLTLWGREPAQRSEHSPTGRSLALRSQAVRPRGIPVPASGRVELTAVDLRPPEDGWDRRRDLLYYGAVPGSADGSAVREGGGPS